MLLTVPCRSEIHVEFLKTKLIKQILDVCNTSSTKIRGCELGELDFLQSSIFQTASLLSGQILSFPMIPMMPGALGFKGHGMSRVSVEVK